jgi:hypothetical protein
MSDAKSLVRVSLALTLLTGGFGLILLLIPGLLLYLVGLAATPPLELLGRVLGGQLLGAGYLYWMIGKSRSEGFIRTVGICGILQDGSSAIVLGFASLEGIVNALGWLLTAIYVGACCANLWFVVRARKFRVSL